ncbi:MAG: hypothetical protein B5M56_09395 [Desulfococcus sp. 4484_241]|nr:MAG: hypothetical protein B5M56_09395 [Desulfococcus sp. 4484_241]
MLRHPRSFTPCSAGEGKPQARLPGVFFFWTVQKKRTIVARKYLYRLRYLKNFFYFVTGVYNICLHAIWADRYGCFVEKISREGFKVLSTRARRFNFFLKNVIKPPQAFIPMTPGVMRGLRWVVEAGNKVISRTPAHVSIKDVNAGGVPGEWTTCGDEIVQGKVIYYLHGGGYFFCSPATHRPFVWRLSRETKVPVLSLDYRMVPEYTLDDCRQDAVKGYKWLLEQGYDSDSIVIGGDSAGGGLTLLTLLFLRDNGIPLPKAAFCLSPFADMTATSPTFTSNLSTSHMFHKNALTKVENYLSAGKDPRDPYVSPAFGDYKGLPPLFVQASDTELLLNDSLLVVDRAKKAGVDVRFRLWHNLPHVFSVFSDFLPEGKAGVKEIAAFVNRHIHEESPALDNGS